MSELQSDHTERSPMLYCARAVIGDDVEVLVGRTPDAGEWYSASALWGVTTTAGYLSDRHALSASFEQLRSTGQLPPRLTVGPQSYLAPIDTSNKVIAVGLNYHDHLKELGVALPQEPYMFTKPGNTINSASGDVIADATLASQLDYESELAVVLDRDTKNLSPADALAAVGGLMVANDVSAREWYIQSTFLQWVRMKGQDGFCPLGPWITPVEEVDLSRGLGIRCWVNGELRQSSSTDQMIFNIGEVVSFVSGGLTLRPGDVVLTGSPAGVAMCMEGQPWLQDGDEVVCEIDGLGRLVNTMRKR